MCPLDKLLIYRINAIVQPGYQIAFLPPTMGVSNTTQSEPILLLYV
jgi:hypothetical protein